MRLGGSRSVYYSAANISSSTEGRSGDESEKGCARALTEIDAFLYGLPGGLLFSGILLLCFVMFGNALTGQANKNLQPSASSNTRMDKGYLLGKKNKRGPPPSQELRRLDVNQLALRDDAPDDIKAMVRTGQLAVRPNVTMATQGAAVFSTPNLTTKPSRIVSSKMTSSKITGSNIGSHKLTDMASKLRS